MNEYETKAQRLHAEIRTTFHDPGVTVVTVVSMNNRTGGQWIIGDPEQDPKLVAARLRLCAAILDPQQRDLTA